jgi:hypothetical protein
MYLFVRGVLILLLAISAPWAEGKPKDNPAKPAEQYQALLREYQEALKAYQVVLGAAEAPEDRKVAAHLSGFYFTD